jgi:hypothetical protein
MALSLSVHQSSVHRCMCLPQYHPRMEIHKPALQALRSAALAAPARTSSMLRCASRWRRCPHVKIRPHTNGLYGSRRASHWLHFLCASAWQSRLLASIPSTQDYIREALRRTRCWWLQHTLPCAYSWFVTDKPWTRPPRPALRHWAPYHRAPNHPTTPHDRVSSCLLYCGPGPSYR